jgi:hypothetical protein
LAPDFGGANLCKLLEALFAAVGNVHFPLQSDAHYYVLEGKQTIADFGLRTLGDSAKLPHHRELDLDSGSYNC